MKLPRATEADQLVFLSGKRTAFGGNSGSLRAENPTDLLVCAGSAALRESGITPQEIHHVIIGNVIQCAADSAYTPRHAGLRLGIPQEVPALGINRLCGSGFQVVIEAQQQMLSGESEFCLVGGVENMSMSPHVLRNSRVGLRGHSELRDSMLDALTDSLAQMSMGDTAESLGQMHGVTRAEADAFAVRSQGRYQAALLQGYFTQEIATYELKDKAGKITAFAFDEHPRAGTTVEKIRGLKSVFKTDGLVTAANASGIVDGAAVLVVAAQGAANARGLKPLGRLVAYGIAGCDPHQMGIGPVPAIRIALEKAGLELKDMDRIEINEAFAAQNVAVAKVLGVAPEMFNVNGGAIAMGHPLAASGTRITLSLLLELKRHGLKRGVAAACIGGGQGIALIVEALP